MRDVESTIRTLEALWSVPDGILFRMRAGEYESDWRTMLVDAIRCVELVPGEPIPARVVALLWWLPMYLTWQKERVGERGADMQHFENTINAVQEELDKVLGVP